MTAATIAIYRSGRRSACEERAFVLAAVGIASAIRSDGMLFVLEVDDAQRQSALAELAEYEAESRPASAAPPPARHQPHAWVGCLAYVVILLVTAHLVAGGFVRLDAFDLGELDAARVQGGQW